MIFHLFLQLMRKDLTLFRRIYWGKFFDTTFFFVNFIIVFGYFMPLLGLPTAYGVFILIGAIASFGLFDIIEQVGALIFDIEGDRAIIFTLSLPVPSWVIFCRLAINWALQTFLLCTPLFLIGKLVLWQQFDLTKINLWQLILIYPTVCLFFGFFSLWLAGLVQIKNLGALYFRFINPLYMFGGFFFTWQSSFELSPFVGYALLINPLIYVMEGTRAATLGQIGYLPFWANFLALWGFIFVLGFHGIKRLKKRLDCI